MNHKTSGSVFARRRRTVCLSFEGRALPMQYSSSNIRRRGAWFDPIEFPSGYEQKMKKREQTSAIYGAQNKYPLEYSRSSCELSLCVSLHIYLHFGTSKPSVLVRAFQYILFSPFSIFSYCWPSHLLPVWLKTSQSRRGHKKSARGAMTRLRDLLSLGGHELPLKKTEEHLNRRRTGAHASNTGVRGGEITPTTSKCMGYR